VRIINARRATTRERQDHEKNTKGAAVSGSNLYAHLMLILSIG